MRSYTRHQLKQDKFAEATKDTFSWAVEHRNKIVTSTIAVVVILVVVVGGWLFYRYREQQASLKLGHAMRTLEAPIVPANTPGAGMLTFTSVADRAKAANREFADIASSYSWTPSGKIARYFVGITAMHMGDAATAERQLKDASGAGNADVAALAKFALASLYRGSNREAQAIELYKQLAENPAPAVPKSTAQLELAALYESKQRPEAVKLYEQIAKENAASPAAQMANARLQSLK